MNQSSEIPLKNEQVKKDEFEIGSLKMLASYTTAFLIFMSTTRLVVENQIVGLPIMNYLNFPDLITYILDIIYGLNRLVIVVALVLIFSKPITYFIESRIISKSPKKKLIKKFLF